MHRVGCSFLLCTIERHTAPTAENLNGAHFLCACRPSWSLRKTHWLPHGLLPWVQLRS